MKAIHWIIAAAALASVLPAPADAAEGDPEVIIYRFPGVRDNGGSGGIGVATIFSCTNFSGVSEAIRIVTRNTHGMLLTNAALLLHHLDTFIVATHATVAYPTLLTLNTGLWTGTAAIAATSTSVICTAMVIDASTTAPVGVALRGIRFNPVPGSQE